MTTKKSKSLNNHQINLYAASDTASKKVISNLISDESPHERDCDKALWSLAEPIATHHMTAWISFSFENRALNYSENERAFGNWKAWANIAMECAEELGLGPEVEILIMEWTGKRSVELTPEVEILIDTNTQQTNLYAASNTAYKKVISNLISDENPHERACDKALWSLAEPIATRHITAKSVFSLENRTTTHQENEGAFGNWKAWANIAMECAGKLGLAPEVETLIYACGLLGG